MSSLECIDNDFEEEIARSIKDVCLMVLGKDFDFDEVCRELQHQPIRLKFLGRSVETQAKIAVDYSTYVSQLIMALDLNLPEAEARIRKRTVPKILKKINEGRPRIRKTEGK